MSEFFRFFLHVCTSCSSRYCCVLVALTVVVVLFDSLFSGFTHTMVYVWFLFFYVIVIAHEVVYYMSERVLQTFCALEWVVVYVCVIPFFSFVWSHTMYHVWICLCYCFFLRTRAYCGVCGIRFSFFLHAYTLCVWVWVCVCVCESMCVWESISVCVYCEEECVCVLFFFCVLTRDVIHVSFFRCYYYYFWPRSFALTIVMCLGLFTIMNHFIQHLINYKTG